jgi:hypothetical protein
VTVPFQPVLAPPQPAVEVLEQRLVAAGGEHRHPPGDVAVKRADHAVPAGRDDRVVEGDQRPHQHLQGLGVTVGQVLQPGWGPAGTVPPQAGQFGAQIPARGELITGTSDISTGAQLLVYFLAAGKTNSPGRASGGEPAATITR